MDKNKKISASLKRHYSKKRTRLQRKKEIKTIIWCIAFIALIGASVEHSLFIPVKAEAPYAWEHNSFPIAEDRIYETTREEVVAIANEHNFEWIDYLLRLSTCENREHIIDLDANAGNHPSYSLDRGLFAINSFWHEEVSDECAKDIRCSTEWTMWMIESGKQGQWMCNGLVLNNPNKYNWK